MANKEEVVNFSLSIEQLVEEKACSYMEAIILYCEKIDLEVEVAAKMLSGAIKSKLRMEAEELHFLPRSNNQKLPV